MGIPGMLFKNKLFIVRLRCAYIFQCIVPHMERLWVVQYSVVRILYVINLTLSAWLLSHKSTLQNYLQLLGRLVVVASLASHSGSVETSVLLPDSATVAGKGSTRMKEQLCYIPCNVFQAFGVATRAFASVGDFLGWACNVLGRPYPSANPAV